VTEIPVELAFNGSSIPTTLYPGTVTVADHGPEPWVKEMLRGVICELVAFKTYRLPCGDTFPGFAIVRLTLVKSVEEGLTNRMEFPLLV
jgi:hypothetical protein